MANFDSDRFIIEVEQKPAIWDSRCNDYNNKVAKGRAWEELCVIFVPGFNEMDSLMKNNSAMNLQRKWKSFRDSFRRELAKLKSAKSGNAADSGRKQYMYFKQLSFLLPICETKLQQETEGSQGPAEDSNATFEDPQILPRPSVKKKKRKASASEEQLIYKVLAKRIERKCAERDDPDKHFLLSLIPHFRGIPEAAKLQVQGQFISILQRFKQQASFASHFCPSANNFFPSQVPHSFSRHYSAGLPSFEPKHTEIVNSCCTNSMVPTPVSAVQPDCPSTESGAASELSDSSSVCSDYF